MNSEGFRQQLEALREQRAGIDFAIEQLEAQIEARSRPRRGELWSWRSSLPEAEAPTCYRG